MKNLKDSVRVLDDIPVKINVADVLARLRMRGDTKRIEAMIQELIEMVTQVARPKVIYTVSEVSNADGKNLEVDGVEFTHHVPALNFSQGERVFPYVATCGVEIETIKLPPGNAMKGYCLDIIKNMVLRSAGNYLQDHLKQTYHLEEISRLAPGEAMGTTAQQPKLFSILGDVDGSIGVRLNAHNIMLPEKSNSGIYFETSVKIESCQLCPNDCRGRRAPYDPELFIKFRKKPQAAN
mgnify:CR=1 FL=1